MILLIMIAVIIGVYIALCEAYFTHKAWIKLQITLDEDRKVKEKNEKEKEK